MSSALYETKMNALQELCFRSGIYLDLIAVRVNRSNTADVDELSEYISGTFYWGELSYNLPAVVKFEATAITNAVSAIITEYAWEIRGFDAEDSVAATYTGKNIQHSFLAYGPYVVDLTITDSTGASTVVRKTLIVKPF